MSTITGTGALAGSEVRILICTGTNYETRSVVKRQTVRADNAGNWSAQVQPAPTAAGTYVEVQTPHASGPDTYASFTLADDQGGAVVDLASANPVSVTGRSDDVNPLTAVLALTSGGAANTMPKAEVALVGANSEGAVSAGPWTIAATTDVAGVTLTAPTFASGSLVANKIELSVSNAAGTQKLVLDVTGTPITLTTGQVLIVDFASATVVKTVGSDLAWDTVGKQIKSTAGGEFFVDALAILTPTNIVG